MQASLSNVLTNAVRKSDDSREQWQDMTCFTFALERFHIEGFSHYSEKRYGKRRACINWLQGIALDIPYINSEIEYLGFDSETYWSDLANTLLDAEYLLDHAKAY